MEGRLYSGTGGDHSVGTPHVTHGEDKNFLGSLCQTKTETSMDRTTPLPGLLNYGTSCRFPNSSSVAAEISRQHTPKTDLGRQDSFI